MELQDSACTVLVVAASIPNCQALCDRCEEVCAKNFDFCTAFHASEFRLVDFACLQRILQVGTVDWTTLIHLGY